MSILCQIENKDTYLQSLHTRHIGESEVFEYREILLYPQSEWSICRSDYTHSSFETNEPKDAGIEI
jgi:hypothetical protein